MRLRITTQPTSVSVEKMAGFSAKRIWQPYNILWPKTKLMFIANARAHIAALYAAFAVAWYLQVKTSPGV